MAKYLPLGQDMETQAQSRTVQRPPVCTQVWVLAMAQVVLDTVVWQVLVLLLVLVVTCRIVVALVQVQVVLAVLGKIRCKR
mmetsp:Transcript_28605/g.65891  ORF Transcript_28605/g.65891 Transcript_28605/m.65891 type:complete len:81 (-) Transcript_28605:65-307(-)